MRAASPLLRDGTLGPAVARGHRVVSTNPPAHLASSVKLCIRLTVTTSVSICKQNADIV